jgi:hypothetical protein
MLDNQPQLKDLHGLIAKVKSYPATAKQLVELAEREHAPQDVIDFYKAFPEDMIFNDKDDLVASSEHIEIMHREDQPQEILLASEED